MDFFVERSIFSSFFKSLGVHVRSLNGKSQTIIDGNNAESVVRFIQEENSQSIIEGFTIQNGYSRFGGGIYPATQQTIRESSWKMSGGIRFLQHFL
jgi:hypothetical protein